MHSRIFLSLLLLAAACAHGQTVPPPPSAFDSPIELGTIIVTGNPDPRTAFDLAQGASVLIGESLHRNEQATLGETLTSLPGVNSTYYGPGASRPIIRGLGGDRVRMLDNGVGSLDASNVSPDHNVSIEPLFADRIEVLRGPTTLLYGSSAVGGVVNVIDNRIPSVAPEQPVSGQTEVRGDTAANERTGVIAATAGNQHFAIQVDALHTETDDVSIPGYSGAPGWPKGTIPNSAISTQSESVGATWFWAAGFLGASVGQYDTTYGIPAGDPPPVLPGDPAPVYIDMKQSRADFRAEITQPFGIFKGAKASFGIADYNHAEVDVGGNTPNTTFYNHAYEGRVELIQEDLGDLGGSFGFQTSRSNFEAIGAEAVTPPSLTYNNALFALEEYKLSHALTLQLGARYEQQSIQLGTVPPIDPAVAALGYNATSGETRTDHGVSLSTGAVYYPAKDYSLGVSLAWSQRIPSAEELYSNGPHGGTGAYEIGSPGLSDETSVGLDLILRKRAGFVTGSVSVFANKFNNFVFEQLLTPQPVLINNPDNLDVYQFIAKDALFYGGEAEASLHLIDTDADRLNLDLGADTVHAQQTTDDQPLPRIPPWRVNAGLRYEHGAWLAGINARHAFDQTRNAPGETDTPGYTLIGADLAYRFSLGRVAYELFARGYNLTNEDARLSTSFLKDVAPLPGRNLTLGLRANF